MCDRNGKRQKVWKRKPQKQNKNMKMWPISRRKKIWRKKGGWGGGWQSWRSNIQILGTPERKEETNAGNPMEVNTVSRTEGQEFLS